jgi:hypothetical protein
MLVLLLDVVDAALTLSGGRILGSRLGSLGSNGFSISALKLVDHLTDDSSQGYFGGRHGCSFTIHSRNVVAWARKKLERMLTTWKTTISRL